MKRRTLATGIAWATPAILIATAAPAMAASAPVVLHATGIACKLPGASCEKTTGVRKGYVVSLRITVPAPTTITLPATIPVTLDGQTQPWTVTPRQLAVTQSGVVHIAIDGQPSSANGALTADLTWATSTATGTTHIHAAATPPCVDCKPEGA